MSGSRRSFLVRALRISAAAVGAIAGWFGFPWPGRGTAGEVRVRPPPAPAPLPRATVALAGDTMLGRKVGEALERSPLASFVADELVEVLREADLVVLNLECCISSRGERWPSPRKPFFFRAPPRAVDLLTRLDVDCVTLANNHALDFGYEALLDTLEHLDSAGIRCVGAGSGVAQARAPVTIEAAGFRLRVVGVTDHPRDFAATETTPGVAFTDLHGEGVPEWLPPLLRPEDAHAVLLTPHWGPNMTTEPPPYVRTAADELRGRATLIAGHSAHVFHGVRGNVLYDLGDFLDDYARDPFKRNDLGILPLVTLEGARLARIEAVPLKLLFCRTEPARGDDEAWVRRRFTQACRAMGTDVHYEAGRLVIGAHPQVA